MEAIPQELFGNWAELQNEEDAKLMKKEEDKLLAITLQMLDIWNKCKTENTGNTQHVREHLQRETK